MSQLNRLFFILLIVSSSAIVTFGSGNNRAGTAAAAELRIPVGARYLALGGSQIASVNGLEAIYWNPAGLDFSKSNANAMFSYRTYIADMNLDYIAVSGKIGDLGSFGVAFKYLDIGTINVTTMNQPDGTGAQINPNFFVLGLTYSKVLTDRIAVGANFNLINESFDRAQASGFSIDIGVQYRSLFSVPGLDLGLAVKNLGGSMQYGGNATFISAEASSASRGPTFYQFAAAENQLPSELGIGLSYSKALDEQNNLTVSTSYNNNNYSYDDYKVGLEYSYDNTLYLRGGYLFSPQSTTITPNIFEDFTLGAGFNLNKVSGIDISVDYAYIPVKYFDSNHVFSINIGL